MSAPSRATPAHRHRVAGARFVNIEGLPMGILISGAISRKARVRLRVLSLVRIGLLLSVGSAMIPAEADNGPLYVAPGPSSLISPDVIKRNQEQLAGTGRKLGDLLGN